MTRVAKFVNLAFSPTSQKKYMAVFYDKDRKRIRTTHFGQKGASDYTLNHDKERKQKYIKRHEKNENWNDAMSAGALSRFILWNRTSIRQSYLDYRNRFNLKLY